MANILSLNKSQALRDNLTKEQQKQLSDMYLNIKDKIKKEIKKLEGRTGVSSALRLQYLQQLEKEINLALFESIEKITGIVQGNMLKMSEQVMNDNIEWMKKLGMPVGGGLLNLPKSTVERILTGKIYSGKWSLNSAIWTDVKKKQKEINEIISMGVAMNKSAYDIAKDLEKFVDPSAKKASRKIPYTDKNGKEKIFYFGKVDYNAQRLARTLVSHAYQKSMEDAARYNPFVLGFKWRSALIHGRTCKICEDRHGKIFKKDELPLDHPNGICTFLIVSEDTEVIGDRIANWVKGGNDKALDKWSDILEGKKPEK